MLKSLETTWNAIKLFLIGQIVIVFLCLAFYGFHANARFYFICGALVFLNVIAFILTPLSSNLHKVVISRVAGGALTGILMIFALSFLEGYQDQQAFDKDQKTMLEYQQQHPSSKSADNTN